MIAEIESSKRQIFPNAMIFPGFVCFVVCDSPRTTCQREMLKDRAGIDRRVERKEGYRSSCKDLGRRYSGKIAVTGG